MRARHLGKAGIEREVTARDLETREGRHREVDALSLDPLEDPAGSGIVTVNRDIRLQHERRDRLLMHLFQHQIHHRGQAHCMLSSTHVKPPQLDEFFLAGDQEMRRAELRALGLHAS